VIGAASPGGIKAIVDQQFELADQVLSHGLIQSWNPRSPSQYPIKAQAEGILRDVISAHLDDIPDGTQVMLKLSLPTVTITTGR